MKYALSERLGLKRNLSPTVRKKKMRNFRITSQNFLSLTETCPIKQIMWKYSLKIL